MPGRKYSAPNSNYRYSINGQEKETELNPNITSAEFWMYDSRLGRRWNVDPVVKEFESPYACFSNNPIARIDVNGDSDTASASRINTLTEVMDGAASAMQKTGEGIKKAQADLKTMQGLINQKAATDIGMSWNIFSWVPQMLTDVVSGGSDLDKMGASYAQRVKEIEGLMVQYNQFLDLYNQAASELKQTLSSAKHLDIGGGVILNSMGGSQMAGIVATSHLNKGSSSSSFALYEIVVDGQTFKYGIADANRVRKTGQWAGYPVRLAQQLSKIAKYAPDLEVLGKVRTILQTTKAEMLVVETRKILVHAKTLGIPIGNVAHIKKYAELMGKGELSAKALQALSKFIKF